jgi:hypothetical protein
MAPAQMVAKSYKKKLKLKIKKTNTSKALLPN